MSTIDIAALSGPLSPESPCGDDLEYDPLFGEMERASQGKPEQEIGDTKVAAEDPDWKELKAKSIAVLQRSRDLRAAVYLTRALAHTDGFAGFADGLELIKNLLEQHWEKLYPLLDPDDDNDPTMRVNAIASLVDADTSVRAVRTVPLVRSRALGQFSLRDIEIANGDAHPEAGTQPVEMSVIEGAFQDCDLEELKGTAEAAVRAADLFAGVDAFLLTAVGTMHAPDLTPLPPVLARIKAVLGEQLQRRGVADAALVGEAAAAEAGGAPAALTGEINSREDVIRALDKICDYFNRYEPSSPVPLLAKRAKKLVSKSFLEILRDMAPGGVHEAESIRGPEE
ncbi:MAG: type VI secretion system protein TssA [Candidatus Eisenbacteria bacterium]